MQSVYPIILKTLIMYFPMPTLVYISNHLGICAENIFQFIKAHNNHIRLQSFSKPLIFHKNYKYNFLLSQRKEDANAIIVAS